MASILVSVILVAQMSRDEWACQNLLNEYRTLSDQVRLKQMQFNASALNPEDVQQAIQAEQQQSIREAPTTLFGSTAQLAATAGQGLGNALGGLGGFSDPRLQRAYALQGARKEVWEQGADPIGDPDKYYEALYQALLRRGLNDEAANVADIFQNRQHLHQLEQAYEQGCTSP